MTAVIHTFLFVLAILTGIGFLIFLLKETGIGEYRSKNSIRHPDKIRSIDYMNNTVMNELKQHHRDSRHVDKMNNSFYKD